MGTEHRLKTWCEYFELVKKGEKNFELRKNDRNFKSNDILILQEYDPNKSEYTGRELTKKVGYILEGGQFGLEEGFVILQLK